MPAATPLLENKVIIVTGASSGIGAATCAVLARHGAKVVMAARRVEESERVLEEVRAAGGEATFIRTDVTDESQVAAMVQHAVETYGRLDGAFNNAGGSFPAQAAWPDNTIEQMQRTFDLNVNAVWLCMKHEIKAMLATGGGTIVNNSSVFGLRGGAAEAYTSAKFAVNGLTRSGAFNLGKQNIRVNAVAPGLTHTELWQSRFEATPGLYEGFQRDIPLGRPARPSEIGDVVAWLCSGMSSYVTGAVIPVDGGWTQTMKRP